MPIYEYACTACGYASEFIHKVSEPGPSVCPGCQATSTMQRLVSAPHFRLGGKGWYETDFKNKEQQRNLVDTADKASDKTTADTSSGGSESGAAATQSQPAANPATAAA